MDCIIIEDQPPAQRILTKFIEDVPSLKLKKVFSNAVEASSFLTSNPIDLIFLDIHLPKISGMQFLKMVENQPLVILTTAFSEYALESYEHNVVDYLLKPFSFDRFLKAVNRALSFQNIDENQIKTDSEKPEKELFIKTGYEHVRIKIDDIFFIKSDSDYTEIITQQKKYLSSESLKYWKKRFKKNEFAQIHKSYLINTNKITKVSGNQVSLENGEKVPIGRYFKEDFLKKVLK